MATCPRSLIVSAGRIVADAPTIELLRDPDRPGRYRLEVPLGFGLRDADT